MGFIDEIKARAKVCKKTIVLPETEDERTYKAAEAVLKEGIADLVLVGSKEEIEKNKGTYDISADKKVVLGLITTKSPELEDKERVIHRINEAAKYVPLERLYLSPQCGFASCEIGNKLTEEQQWEKIKLVKEIAEEVWGE